MLGPQTPFLYNKLIRRNGASPRSIFCIWMGIQGRHPTGDKLNRWGINIEQMCTLCKSADETCDHILYSCPIVADQELMDNIQLSWNANSLQQEIDMMNKLSKRRKSSKARIIVMVRTELIYVLWCFRNFCIFRSNSYSTKIAKSVVYNIAARCGDDHIALLLPK